MAEGVNPELGGTLYRLYYPVDRKGYLSFSAATHSLRSGFNLFLFQYPGFSRLSPLHPALLAVARWAHKFGGRMPAELFAARCAGNLTSLQG